MPEGVSRVILRTLPVISEFSGIFSPERLHPRSEHYDKSKAGLINSIEQ